MAEEDHLTFETTGLGNDPQIEAAWNIAASHVFRSRTPDHLLRYNSALERKTGGARILQETLNDADLTAAYLVGASKAGWLGQKRHSSSFLIEKGLSPKAVKMAQETYDDSTPIFESPSASAPDVVMLGVLAEATEQAEYLVERFRKAKPGDEVEILVGLDYETMTQSVAERIDRDLMELMDLTVSARFDMLPTPLHDRADRAFTFLQQKASFLNGFASDPEQEQEEQRKALLDSLAEDFATIARTARSAPVRLADGEIPAKDRAGVPRQEAKVRHG